MLKRKGSSTVTVFFLLCVLVFSTTFSVSAETIMVQMNNFSSYTTIQQAIDEANPFDTIIIHEGVYKESVVISKPLTLRGVKKSDTIIQAQGGIGCHILSDTVTLQNITIINASTAIFIENGSNCQINHTTIQHNYYGIQISNQSHDCIIYDNNFFNNTYHAWDESATTQWNQFFYGNFWDTYTGIDNDTDGIGDTPFLFHLNSQDPYPQIKPVTIQPHSSFDFTPANPTTQTSISFSDLSYDPDGIIVNWTWKVDDEIFSFQRNPNHRFNDDGAYQVTLTVEDNLQSTHSYSKTIIVKNVQPTISFTFFPELPLDIQEVECKDTSEDPDGTIINRTWVINDSIRYYESTIHHTFPDDGEYTIQLHVTDDDNATSSLEKTIMVKNAGPIAGFTYYTDNGSLVKQMDIHFNENSYDADGQIISYEWDFGDGKTSTEQNPSHQYSNNGRYKISLTVTDDDYAPDSYSRSIQIGENEQEQSILSGLSLFDIFIVVFILAMVIVVIFVSKKYG